MKALVKTKRGVGNVELTERAIPQIKPHEVLIKVSHAGICGTDIKIWDEQAWSNPPVILGHEFSGTVERVGDAVTICKAGDRVVSETAQVVCGSCEYCRGGVPLMCDKRLSIGYGVDGAFAEYIAVRQEIIHKIPDHLDFASAALCEPLAVTIHAVFDGAPRLLSTDLVAVFGPGAIGQLAAQVIKSRGAAVVLLGAGSDTMRLASAKEHGIPYTIDTQSPGAEEEIQRLTAGRGFDYVFECSGAKPAIETALRNLKKTGTMVQVGLTKPVLEVPYGELAAREIQLRGTFGHRPNNWEQAIKLLSDGKLDVGGIISAQYPLEQWRQGFERMKAQDGIKLMLKP